MGPFILIAAASAAYPPPSAYEAEQAVIENLEDGRPARFDPNGPRFTLSLRLERCAFKDSYGVQSAFGGIVLVAGHECLATISRRARPDYQMQGFFHHDGVAWRFFGSTEETLIADSEAYGSQSGYSTQTAKPGSTLYRGDAGGVKTDPYAGIFEPRERPDAPFGRRIRDGLYTDE